MEGLYVTYKVIVMTPFDNSATIACGLINTDLEAGFDWLMEQYRENRTRDTEANLLTATNDADTAMRNALRKLFPDAKLQLCKFHLNKNVALDISRKWDVQKVQPGAPSQELGQVERSYGDKNSSSEKLTAEENRRVGRLNDVVRVIEKVDQSPPQFLGVDQVESRRLAFGLSEK
ncbi:hypothetical protein PsorP6_011071 [Peronosclerospora sorghi]|uniref:Uncharacterized protein n=1 Tax=Peronosclerospora sorghi TaxID=230839 RepID=A0ACC0VUW6_9STRA|nr:hypothetical protein PsorP6_011071 [Peronosclerospora sorghi]